MKENDTLEIEGCPEDFEAEGIEVDIEEVQDADD